MENQQRQQIKKYLDLLVYRWKWLVICLLVALTTGLVFYLRQPQIYRSTALLSYEQQQINPTLMSPEQGKKRLRDTVSTLSQIVISRNNLESIIRQFNLYEEARKTLPIEDVIDMMRKNITIDFGSGGDTFTVSFDGTNQGKVQKVTNALAAKFIEENLKYREARAVETSRYTEDELAMAKRVLDQKEAAMRDYKLKYYNELPDQREANMTRLSALYEQYQQIQDSLQNLEHTKIQVLEQISLRKRLQKQAASIERERSEASDSAGSPTLPVDRYERLEKLRDYLAMLQDKYTDKHPEVKRTKKMIARLEAELEEEPVTQKGDKPKKKKKRVRINPEIQQLEMQLADIDFNLKNLREDKKTIKAEIEKYNKWIAMTPIREAEWSELTRDYDQLRRHYDYLVSKNLQAESAEHLEKKQKGSKFKIVDSARFPEKPYRPDFLRILLVSAGIGLLTGAALIFGLDFVDTSFKDVYDIEAFLEVPVVCSVPYIENTGERQKNRLMFFLWCFIFFLYTAILVAAFAYYWKQGRIIL